MALGACMAGGLVIGIAGMVSPSLAATGASSHAEVSASDHPSDDLGDTQVSYPTTSTSPEPSLYATPAISEFPAATRPVETVPTSVAPSSPPSASPEPSISRPAKVETPRPARSTESPPARTIPNRPDLGTPFVNTTAPPEPRRQRAATETLGNWTAPHLAVGLVDISPPKLSSKAKVNVTVMCSPSTSCIASDNTLTINKEAQHVTVTWNAHGGDQWRAWSASASYARPAGG